jgi:hypothetical protein
MFFRRSQDPKPTSTDAVSRDALLASIEEALSKNPQLGVSRGTDTDLELKSVLADASWGVGKKKVEFSACLTLRERDNTVVYWEMIKETGSGMGVFGGFKTESYSTFGKTRSGSVKEVGVGPAGKVIDYAFSYDKTRTFVEDMAKQNGWKFATVLRRGSATRGQ